ncbi:MAG: Calcineurin-like phosphoesterase superfamily domain protein [Gemmatimonadetes bacterium]|nr:Calcineurin-like phosphoesterase superfamily domain protein [Gemmatimonadota bacterium]
MKLLHLSDTHLGFRQYDDKSTTRGLNPREADVARSFTNAIDIAIRVKPDVVLIAGDIFHAVRPPNSAIVHAIIQFKRLQAALPETEIILISGNHDTPRSTKDGGILRVFATMGLHVVDGAPKVLDFPALDLAVLCVAENQHERGKLEPTGDRRFNVLLLHGEAEGIGGKWHTEHEIATEDFHAPAWDYIALGHYHVYRELAPNMFYSGSIDYTSSDIWGERREEQERHISGKGVIERDLVTGAHTFHPLPRTREIHDLSIDAVHLSPAEVSTAVRDVVESVPGGIDGAIVRVVARDIEAHIKRDLDHAMLRDFRARAMHFALVERRPPVKTLMSAEVHQMVRRRAPLAELVAEMLGSRELPSDIDRAEFEALGMEYLEQSEDRTAAAAPALAGTA